MQTVVTKSGTSEWESKSSRCMVVVVCRLTFELTGPLRWDGLARAGKMYRVPQAGPRRPAVVGPVVQRGVRPHPHNPEVCRRVRLIAGI